MAYMKQGSQFLYDDTTGEVVGVKDPSGVDRYFASSTFNAAGMRQRGRVFILDQWAVPVGITPTGSIGNNGALTLGTALQVIHSNGIWLYFPANAIQAGSAAGIYWVVMSSTTAGTIYNTTLSGTPYIPTRNVAFSTTGPGAYTGATSAINLATTTIPGLTLGLNGGMRVDFIASMNSSAGAKTMNIKVDGSSIHSTNPTTFTVLRNLVSFRNMQSHAINMVSTTGVSVGAATTSGSVVRRTIDTSIDKNIVFEGNLATATDYLILEGATIEVLPR